MNEPVPPAPEFRRSMLYRTRLQLAAAAIVIALLLAYFLLR